MKILEGKAKSLKVKELQKYLEKKGINKYGKKAELIERIHKRLKN